VEKLHNEELSDVYSLPDIIQVIKSRRMRWAGHVARIGVRRGAYRVLAGENLRERNSWINLDVNGKIDFNL
jgi:hypothetical protein